jgi:DnaJ-class molecular chaperone
MATERSYYEILGVERTAGDAEIKRAFRRLAQQWHPDVNSGPEAAERFKEINEAYQVLSDPQRRQVYDVMGRAGLGDMGGSPFGEGFPGFGDLFDAFFAPPAPTCATTCASSSRRRFAASNARSSSICSTRARSATGRARPRAVRPFRAPPAAAGARSARCARRCWARWST